MKIIQAASAFWSTKEDGVKVDCNLVEDNGLLDIIKSNLKDTKKFVYIANDPDNYADNDEGLKFILLALSKHNIEFDESVIIDRRNDFDLSNSLSNASIVYLPGGRVDNSSDYYYDLGLEDYLKDIDALLIGQSAGAMNFAEVIYNYPENNEDVEGLRFLEGMNLCWPVIIPHYNNETGNELCFGDFNLLNDYYIPDSKLCDFYALKNGSYIFTNGDVTTVYGEAYFISKGIVVKICENNNSREISDETHSYS